MKLAATNVEELEAAIALAFRELENNTGFKVKRVEEKGDYNLETLETDNLTIKIILGT